MVAAWGVLLIVGCQGMGFNPKSRPAQLVLPNPPHEVDLTIVRDLPLVQVRLNDAGPYWFLIDTGAFTTIVDTHVAHEAGIGTSVRYGTHTTDAGSTFGRMHLASFDVVEIGAARFEDFEGLSIDLDHLAEALGHPLDGVIGMPVIARCDWTIDYPRRRLRFDPPGSLTPGDDVMPFIWSKDAPAVAIFIGDEEFSAEIDTGGTPGLELSEEDATRVRFIGEPMEGPMSTTLNGRVSGQIVMLRDDLRVGALTIPVPQAHLSRETTIGGETLRHVSLTIDSQHHLIRMTPGGDSGPASADSSTGGR